MIKKTVNKEKFGKRLAQLMNDHHETTYSMAEKFSLSSPTISRYMTGQMAAKITTIELMAKYFHVNPVWLMGFDVPKDIEQDENKILSIPAIMSYYNQLNTLGQETATEQVRLLTLDKKYTEQNVQRFPSSVSEPGANYLLANAAHGRIDTEFTEEDRKADDDMLD